MQKSPKIRIIIVAYDSMSCLTDCISALAAQSYGVFEVIIIDNGGADTADGYHAVVLPDTRFKHNKNPENTGYSGGMIRGVKGAQSKWVMSINPDTSLHPNCLKNLLSVADLYDDPAMLTPCLFSDHSEENLDGLGDSLSIMAMAWRNAHGRRMSSLDIPAVVEVFSPSGAAAVYLREAYENAGGINGDFFCYMEDVDLGLRLRAHGGRCLLVRDATGIHSGGHSTNKLTGFAIKYGRRNTLLMIVSSAPFLLMLLLLPMFLASRAILKWRTHGSENAKFRAQGTREAIPLLWSVFRKRFDRPTYPLGASFRVMKRLSWRLSHQRTRALKYWDYPKPK